MNITLEHGLDTEIFSKQRNLIYHLSRSNLLSARQRQQLQGIDNLLDEIADQVSAQGLECRLQPWQKSVDVKSHIETEVRAVLNDNLPPSAEQIAELIAHRLGSICGS